MMTYFFWIGTALGFVVGLSHAIHIVSTQSLLPGRNAIGSAIYRALWALVLWTLFGSYLLALWIIGAVLSALSGRRAQRRQAA